MKKFFITILAALVAGGMVSAMGHVSFPDIPEGHWAGDAVEEIADLGIVIGFPDGTFRGNEAFTRYQSALVISRLLAVIDANMDAELGALRGAMQSMAADLAAQGVRLAAAESAIAAISDTLDVHAGLVGANADGVAANAAGVAANAAGVAANAARIDALEAAMADMPTGMDEAVLRDLQNQIASVRVAADTAQAQAAAAEARAAGAYDLALQALAGSDALAADVAALNQVVQLLSQRVDGLAAPAPAPAPAVVDLSGIDRNAGDIANIRDFVILLRRDQVALRDRVTALEASGAATAASVEGLEARVAALEAKPFLDISGSIALNYQVGRTIGAYDFDVDRVYGLNARRDIGASFFSTGTADLDGDGTSGNDVGERRQDRADITARNGVVTPSITVTVSMDRDFVGTGSPRGLNTFSAVATFEAEVAGSGTGDRDITFVVTDFETTFEPIGAAPLTFAYGQEIEVEFTTYVFVVDEEHGYVATVSAPDFLAFLNPGLTAAYVSDQTGGYWRGIRGTMAPAFGDAITLSGGVSFAQQEDNAADKDDVLGDNATISVWGVDGEIGLLGLVDVAFEYANNLDSTDSVLWVTAAASADLGFLNIESLGGNYRALDAGFYGIGATGDEPFERDQTGFGVEGELGLFGLLDVVAFYDNYTSSAPTAESGYGVEVDVDLFVGFSLSGFFENALVDGVVADATANAREVDAGYELLDGVYATKFGVELKHDGAASNALISGLNITAGYQRSTANYSRQLIYANADYALTVAIVTVTPYVGYRMWSDSDAPAGDYSELVAGTGLSTSELDFFLKPSLMGAVNYRATTYNAFTASELQWSVGLKLGEFLLPNSSLTAKVGQWVGTNTTTTTNTIGAGDGATDISVGRSGDANNGDQAESVFGYEVEWNYYDLRFAYGAYDSSRDWGTAASAQAFSIKYTVTF
ncbi:MAG: S-layer homology domain-containing protein [Trueperaceae bacterium]|nr:S-layer homology domain-containing protein [Trueperaceae bacterium]